MTELEKAFSGKKYDRRAPEIVEFQNKVKDLCFEFNHTKPSDPRRSEILTDLVTVYSHYVLSVADLFKHILAHAAYRAAPVIRQ